MKLDQKGYNVYTRLSQLQRIQQRMYNSCESVKLIFVMLLVSINY